MWTVPEVGFHLGVSLLLGEPTSILVVGNLVHQNQEDPTSEHEEWSIPQTRGSPSQQAPHVVDRRSRDESYVRGKSEPTGTQVFARSSPAGTTGPDLVRSWHYVIFAPRLTAF